VLADARRLRTAVLKAPARRPSQRSVSKSDELRQADVVVSVAKGSSPSTRPFVRTPDECFDALPDYPWSPNYAEVDGMRMHHVETGDRASEVVLPTSAVRPVAVSGS
jgi:hypothetical protein